MKEEIKLVISPRQLCLAITLMGLGSLGLTSCATSDQSGGTIEYPDPVDKQYQLQEKMSQVTRSFL